MASRPLWRKKLAFSGDEDDGDDAMPMEYGDNGGGWRVVDQNTLILSLPIKIKLLIWI